MSKTFSNRPDDLGPNYTSSNGPDDLGPNTSYSGEDASNFTTRKHGSHSSQVHKSISSHGPSPVPVPGSKKKKKNDKNKKDSTSLTASSSGSGSNSSTSRRHLTPEEGDYIINWHVQYCANIFLQYSSTLMALQDQIKAELMKIKADGDFIKNLLPGPHTHLVRLKNEDRDLRSALDPINNLNDLFRLIASRAANRLI